MSVTRRGAGCGGRCGRQTRARAEAQAADPAHAVGTAADKKLAAWSVCPPGVAEQSL